MLSRGARWTIAIAAIATGAGMLWVGQTLPNRGGAQLFAAFCFLIAVLCVAPYTAPITARVIGAALLLVCVWYLVDELRHPEGQPSPQATPLHAVRALLILGLPGAYLLIRGRLPRWSRFHSAFHGHGRGNGGGRI